MITAQIKNAAASHRQLRGQMISMFLVGLVTVLLAGCSPKRLVVNLVGNALAESGDVYASDDDLELVGGAVPRASWPRRQSIEGSSLPPPAASPSTPTPSCRTEQTASMRLT